MGMRDEKIEVYPIMAGVFFRIAAAGDTEPRLMSARAFAGPALPQRREKPL